ncbi:MAG: type II toxin-antitoxin system HicA family toxin [bacterium]|nr:type II toxin-antitoxin system HicA family toxin [bacterium]
MKNLPALTARQVIRALKRAGFREDRQKGSHLLLINYITKRRTVIPIHRGRTIKKPLLQSIIEKDAGLTIEEFLQFL